MTQTFLNKDEPGHKRALIPETAAYMTRNLIGDAKGIPGGDGLGSGYGDRVVSNEPVPRTAKPTGALGHFSIEDAWFWIDPATNLSSIALGGAKYCLQGAREVRTGCT